MAEEENKDLPLFTKVSEGVYRGAQPTEEGYKQLKDMGIKTLVNFRHEEDEIEFGRENAEKNGLEYINISWTIFGDAKDENWLDFFRVLENPEKQPVFFHCKRGAERTGVMSYSYYRYFDKLSHDEAWAKAFDPFPLKWIWKPFVKKKIKHFNENILQA